MNRKLITLKAKTTELIEESGLFITLKQCYSTSCNISLGYSGLPNEHSELDIGDAVLFQTPSEGMFEIRLMDLSSVSANFLLSQISSQPGLIAGTDSQSQENSSFTASEVERIEHSISLLKDSIAEKHEFTSEQIKLVHKTLDEVKDASNRLGRKDWINYTAGLLTSVAVSAAFSNDARHVLFSTANSVFSWLFTSAFTLLASGT
ncbi:hypothetical protein WM008_23250 [Vibrio vulnificus]|uniref:hypothetical protein n=1 Tax=Vibrio TaxID=662 RepID=UPI000576E197|nr:MULTISPECIES: hypothetical protein [Vibrio]AVW99064.1 hypothetical protein BJD94_03615 [Vibrio vulnificus Env1]EGQ7984286.1 hypothetical protein [Vibrio vulnificus]EGQ9284078.1 hypothetical protein [Vibrio vulnificus]EHU9521054.1 hypothetical protein [Vibrio vulnificus]MCK8085401.1 hypothetical protein [Vibrio sp. 1CM8B]